MVFETFVRFKKSVSMSEFKALSSENFFSTIGKENAQKTLSKYDDAATEILVDYDIIIKKIKE